MRVTANSLRATSALAGGDETQKTIPDIDPSHFDDEDLVEDVGVDVVALKKFVDQLLEKDEKNEIHFEELEDRVQRVELNTGVREQLVKKVQNDLNAMVDRVNKIENTGKIKGALAAAGLDANSIAVILEAVNEMQDRVTSQTNDKLESHAKLESVTDLKNESEVLARRITFSEGVIQKNEQIKREYNEKFETNRVRIQKIFNEINVLRRA